MKASSGQDYRERIVRTFVYVQGHLDAELELEEVAGVGAFFPRSIFIAFSRTRPESLKEHLRRLRLERVARDLKLRDGASGA
jgi:AraC family transcriptional regulator